MTTYDRKLNLLAQIRIVRNNARVMRNAGERASAASYTDRADRLQHELNELRRRERRAA